LKYDQIKDHNVFGIVKAEKNLRDKISESENRNLNLLFNYILILSEAKVNVGSEIYNSSMQTKVKFIKLMANCNLKNTAALGLVAKAEQIENLFCNHIIKTLMNIHQVNNIKYN
jgi:hypothetical protein